MHRIVSKNNHKSTFINFRIIQGASIIFQKLCVHLSPVYKARGFFSLLSYALSKNCKILTTMFKCLLFTRHYSKNYWTRQSPCLCCHRTFFFFFLPCLTTCGILVPRPGIEPMPPEVEARSLNHWFTREVPNLYSNGREQTVSKYMSIGNKCKKKEKEENWVNWWGWL